MAEEYLLEGPFESDYSLALVNRHLAYSLLETGRRVLLHQRDNHTSYFPSIEFLANHPRLRPLFVESLRGLSPAIHSRCIYPPYTDNMVGDVNAIHSYGWEESVFPAAYVGAINRDLDLITVVSEYVRDVLRNSGVTVPIEVIWNGVDHVLVPSRQLDLGYANGNEFVFLHVSSCFPRKGCDVLVEAFCQEFAQAEAVRLVIKTFPNPHNQIEEIVSRSFRKYPDHGAITVTAASCDYGQMRFLYEHADCLVSPSRGEGFGLPAGEAMLLGLPVIATMHGGQAEMCSPATCWPVEYELQPAKTHMALPHSYWAEPQIGSLRQQMRRLYQAKRADDPELAEKIRAARIHVNERFSWRQVVDRQLQACENSSAGQRHREFTSVVSGKRESAFRLGVVSPWNSRCGIAEYSRYLLEGFRDNEYRIFAPYSDDLVGQDTDRVFRCWKADINPQVRPDNYQGLVRSIISQGCSAVSFQFNFGFFRAAILDFLFAELKRAGVFVSITMHSIEGPNSREVATAIQRADVCIVHRRADRDALTANGLQNVVLLEQGVPAPYDSGSKRRACAHAREFVVSTFGFFLPPKGVYELIQAIYLARRLNPRVCLKLLNAVYPADESRIYARTCLGLISELNLGSAVEVSTGFLSDQEILRELSISDLIALPYVYSTESSSAAVRLPLSSLAPVLCSDLPIFAELEGIAHKVRPSDICALSRAIARLSTNPPELRRYAKPQAAFVDRFSWANVSRRFQDLHQAHRLQTPISETGPTVSLSVSATGGQR